MARYIVEELERLWGAVVHETSWQLAAHTFTVRGEIIEDGASSRFELELRGVTELRFTAPNADTWDYVELTAVYVSEEAGTDRIAVSLVFWSEDCSVSASCLSVAVNGQIVLAR